MDITFYVLLGDTSMETANRIIRIRQVMEITGLAKPTIYLHMQQRCFPKQIKLGPKAAGWLLSEVESWLASRVAARG